MRSHPTLEGRPTTDDPDPESPTHTADAPQRPSPAPADTSEALIVSTTALDAVARASTIIIAAPPRHGADALVEQWIRSCASLGTPATPFRCHAADPPGLWSAVAGRARFDSPATHTDAVDALFGAHLPVLVLDLHAGADMSEMLEAVAELGSHIPHLRTFIAGDDPLELHRASSANPMTLVLDGADIALGVDDCLAVLRERWPAASRDEARVACDELGGIPGLLAAWLRRADDQQPVGQQATVASIDRAMQAIVTALPCDDGMRTRIARLAVASGMAIDTARVITPSFDEALALLLSRGLATPLLRGLPRLQVQAAVRRALIAGSRDAMGAPTSQQDPVALALRASGPVAALEVAVEQGRWTIAAAIAHSQITSIVLSSTPRTVAALTAIPTAARVDETRFAALVELCGGPSSGAELTPEPLRPPLDRGLLARVAEPARLLFDGHLALAGLTERGEIRRAHTLHRSLDTFISVREEAIGTLARYAPAMRFARAMSSLAREDTADAIACLRPCQDGSPPLPVEALELRVRAAAHAVDGRARRARHLLQRARRFPSSESIPWIDRQLEEVTEGFLALDTARPRALVSLAMHSDARQPMFVRHSRLYLRARVRPWNEHDDALDDDLDAALHRDRTPDGTLECPILEAALLERAWQRGTPIGDGTPNAPVATLSSLARQRTLFANGQDGDVIALAWTADDPACPPIVRIESMRLGAQSHRRLGNEIAASALDAAAAAIDVEAGRTGSRRLIIPPEHRAGGAQDLLGSLQPTRERPAPTGRDWSALSRTEWEVLRELSTEMSLDEIAALRYVSRNTVKSQIGAIYRKLGVRSRAEAIEALRARTAAQRLHRQS